jgi:hypothetical protein
MILFYYCIAKGASLHLKKNYLQPVSREVPSYEIIFNKPISGMWRPR